MDESHVQIFLWVIIIQPCLFQGDMIKGIYVKTSYHSDRLIFLLPLDCLHMLATLTWLPLYTVVTGLLGDILCSIPG